MLDKKYLKVQTKKNKQTSLREQNVKEIQRNICHSYNSNCHLHNVTQKLSVLINYHNLLINKKIITIIKYQAHIRHLAVAQRDNWPE